MTCETTHFASMRYTLIKKKSIVGGKNKSLIITTKTVGSVSVCSPPVTAS